MNVVVVDACLLVALVLNDSRSELVQQKFDYWLNESFELHAPKLIHYEIANSLTKSIHAKSFPEEELANTYQRLGDLPITYHLPVEGTRIVTIALSLGRQSAYDAAYVALAESLNAELWTLDKKLYNNAIGCKFDVKLLA